MIFFINLHICYTCTVNSGKFEFYDGSFSIYLKGLYAQNSKFIKYIHFFIICCLYNNNNLKKSAYIRKAQYGSFSKMKNLIIIICYYYYLLFCDKIVGMQEKE